MIAKLARSILIALTAAFFIAGAAHAQNGGTVTNHAFAIGKGAGVTGYGSALCTSAQIAVGQSSADPLCKTITGDATLSAAGALTFATVNANVGSFGSATQCVAMTVNAKGLITAASASTCAPAIGSITGLGTGVLTALGINVGSAGAFVTFNGALGTPSSGTLTSATGLPISTGVSGLGTGIATALAINVGTAGSPVVNGGALGTPSSGVGTNLTGTAAGLTAGHVTTNANLTGDVTSVGNATTLAAGNAGNLNSGTLLAARMPALTGDVTTTAGTVATTIAAAAVTNSKLATAGAATLKGNPTNATASVTDFTIQGLTARGAPDAANDKIPIYDNAAGTIKYVTPSQVAGASSGTVTSITAGGGAVSGTGGQTAITTSGTIYAPNGSANKLRNSSLTSWFHGSGSLTITTSGGWGAEGIFIVPTGASVTAAQQSPSGLSNPLTYYSQKITGNTSVTDVTVRFVIESFDAAPLAGQQVMFQVPVLNNTGASITPTITVKRANAQDATYTNTDVSAASLQTIANGATGILSYSWSAPSGTINGLSIDIDFGNNFSTTGKSIQIGGGFDCRVTPGVSTGTVSAPPAPEIRHTVEDIAWNKRFYRTTYPNGTAPGAATHDGMVWTGQNDAATGGFNNILFETPMRATPSISVWDGAGTANKISTLALTSITFTDGGTASNSTTPFQISFAGFYMAGPNAVGHAAGFIHYAADATLSGG